VALVQPPPDLGQAAVLSYALGLDQLLDDGAQDRVAGARSAAGRDGWRRPGDKPPLQGVRLDRAAADVFSTFDVGDRTSGLSRQPAVRRCMRLDAASKNRGPDRHASEPRPDAW